MTKSKKIDRWFSLKGTTCIVAGASGLIGKEVCKSLVECGAEVLALDCRFKGKNYGATFQVDLTQEQEVFSFFKTLKSRKKERREWAFVNCAYPRTENWGSLGFENFTLQDWNKNVELHLGSAFLFMKESVDFLSKVGGGSIVNFGSIYGVLGPDLRIYKGTSIQNPVAYASIKAGVIGLTRYIATAFGHRNIRANAICPGGIENNQDRSFVRAYESRTPLGRMGTTSDVAGMVSFLVGPSSKYISGQVLMVDGGWSAW